MTAAPGTGWRDRGGLVALACALAYLPFTLLGYGTDIDVANVLRSGRSWLDRDYQISRGPGAPLHELGTGLLNRAGGSVLVNLASVAFAAMALWAVHHLVRADGARWPAGATLVLATNPWFCIAATSLGDYVWALALVLTGAVLAQRDHRVAAGVLFGLSLGCRASSVLLVLAWLLAERGGSERPRRPWRDTYVTAAAALAVGVVSFIPPWLAADRTLDFLQENQLGWAGLGVHLGRWGTKNLALVGVIPGIVLLIGLPQLLGALARWQASTVVRFAVVSAVLSELLFLRFPFKPVHLLPVAAALALVVGGSPAVRRSWLVALVVAQLVGGLVGATVAGPDTPDQARAAHLDVSITTGPLLTDVRCRLDDRDRGPWPDPAGDAATQRAAANAACQNETWRGEPG